MSDRRLNKMTALLSFLALTACDAAGGTNGSDMAGGAVPQTDGSSVGPPSTFLMFVTSGQYDGNLGGLSGGDSKCARAASAAKLSGRFIAWLSDSSHNAIDRVTGNGPWYAIGPSDIKLFNNKPNLTTTPLSWGQGATSVITDENGRQADRVWTYWTGTDNGGVASQGKTCGDWIDNTADGLAGKIQSTGFWTNGGSYFCGSQFSLLCIQTLP
jgi:hypothetical protein